MSEEQAAPYTIEAFHAWVREQERIARRERETKSRIYGERRDVTKLARARADLYCFLLQKLDTARRGGHMEQMDDPSERTLGEWREELLRLYEETNGLATVRFQLSNGMFLTICLEEAEQPEESSAR